MDAELNEDVELVILHDLRTGEHIPYKALRTEPEPPKPPPPPDPILQGDWVAHARDGHFIHPYPVGQDPRELSGTFRLEWSTSGRTRSARLVRPTVGTVTEKDGRVRIAASILKRNFYTGVEGRKGKRVLLEEMREVLTLDKTDHKDRDTVVLHSPSFRSLLELLILALVVVRHPPRPSK